MEQAKELDRLKSGHFDNIGEYSYFTTVRAGGNVRQPSTTSEFAAWVCHRLVHYSFFVTYPVAALHTGSVVTVTVRDPSYFVDFTLSRDPPDATRPAGILVEASTADEHAGRFRFPPDLYLGQAPPEHLKTAVVRFRTALS